METSKKIKSKNKLGVDISKIKQAYKELLLTDGKRPSSVFAFCKSKGWKESEFYDHFASFEAIESSIWKGYVDFVRKKLTQDSDYVKFSAREKILAFYFSLVEVLKGDRSFVLYLLKTWKNPALQPSFLNAFHTSFNEWATNVITEGKNSGEIAKRPFIDERYQHLFWIHFLFILQFWSHDNSTNFDKTDAAIEKSVNLAFELIGKGVLDSAIDFGKFLYQHSKN